MVFKKGDKITGKFGSLYGIINSNAIMRVEKTYVDILGNDSMEVKILSHKNYPQKEGSSYQVGNTREYFKLLPNKIKKL